MWDSNRFLKSDNRSLINILLIILFLLGWIAISKFDLFESYDIEFYGSAVFILYVIYLAFYVIKQRYQRTDHLSIIQLNGKKRKWDTFNYVWIVIGILILFSNELKSSDIVWTTSSYIAILSFSFLVFAGYRLYISDNYEKRFLSIKGEKLYFIESKSTYYAPVNEFQKIKMSYNKISAIAKGGRRDRLGGYEMSDGDLLQLIVFLENQAPQIEIEVLFEDTKN